VGLYGQETLTEVGLYGQKETLTEVGLYGQKYGPQTVPADQCSISQ